MIRDLLSAFVFRLSPLFLRRRMEQEIDAELEFHLDALTVENRAQGMSEEAARLAAQRTLGGALRTREEYRDRRTFPFWESVLRDAWCGWRSLCRTPGFTLTAVSVLGLGIGLNVCVVSVVRALCYRPLPLTRAEQIVGITRGHRLLPYPLFEALRDGARAHVDVAAYDPYVTIQVGRTEQWSGGMARAAVVSDNFFPLLDARPSRGLTLQASEGSSTLAAVLSHQMAARCFGAGANPIGATLRLNRRLFTVIGVMARDFQGPDLVLPDLWIRHGDEAALGSNTRQDPDARRWILVGRLATGVTRTQAQAELTAIAARLPEPHPDEEGTHPLELRPAVLFPLNAETLPFLLLLMVPTGMVLLIACANLANLMLARASRRGKEMATRLALGAGRARLIRQLMTESVVLALLGGVAGTLCAAPFLQIASRFLAKHAAGMGYVIPEFQVDFGAWAFMVALSLLAAVACGTTPALQASRHDLAAATRGDGSGVQGTRVRNTLMVAQVAVCTVLLSSAGLMIRSFQRSLTTDPGFATERVMALRYDLASAGYPAARVAELQRQIQNRLRVLPDVRAAALAAAPPLSDRPTISLSVSPSDQQERRANSAFNRVTPDFFRLLAIPVVAGRPFTEDEVTAGAAVAMVSESTARRLWPGEPAVGKRFRIQSDSRLPWRDVVGVVADTRSVWLSRVDENYVYLPFEPAALEPSAILVELDRDTDATRTALTETFRRIDPELPVSMGSMHDVLNRWRLLPLAGSALSMVLGLAALSLSGLGLYGVMVYLVNQRRREFGIRVALGANRIAIVSLVFRQGFRAVLSGLGLGLAGSVGLARVLMGSFYGLSSYDPPAFLFVVGFVGMAALASMYGPASRAAKTNPVDYLREE